MSAVEFIGRIVELIRLLITPGLKKSGSVKVMFVKVRKMVSCCFVMFIRGGPSSLAPSFLVPSTKSATRQGREPAIRG